MKTLPAPKRKTAPNNFSRLVRITETIAARLLAVERELADLKAEKKDD